MIIQLSKKEYERRISLYHKIRDKVVPRELERLETYILTTGKIPKITKTGTLLILLDTSPEICENENNKRNV